MFRNKEITITILILDVAFKKNIQTNNFFFLKINILIKFLKFFN